MDSYVYVSKNVFFWLISTFPSADCFIDLLSLKYFILG